MSRRRVSLRFPRKRTVALIDSSGLSLISRFIPEDAVNVVDIGSPNIFVILRMLILRMKSMHGYNIAFIKATKPSFVFTFIDNNVDFYRLAKHFPNVKFIAIQNGDRANCLKKVPKRPNLELTPCAYSVNLLKLNTQNTFALMPW